MDLSVIVPVFNGADFIASSVELLHSYLSKSIPAEFEIVVVNDGSTDSTRDVLESLAIPNCSAIHLPQNKGKFGAISAGMLAASGHCCVFTDGDIPYDLDAIRYMYELIDKRAFHVVVGDRTLKHSEYLQQQSPLRAAITPIFSTFVRLIVTGGLHDTQCGLKAFRGDVAQAIFPLLQDQSFSGDVELLYLALKYNLEVKRIPVRLRRNAPSSVRVLGHGIRMFFRICRLRGTWDSGRYHSDVLEKISDQRYWRWGASELGYAGCEADREVDRESVKPSRVSRPFRA